jgi:hypothetical protein
MQKEEAALAYGTTTATTATTNYYFGVGGLVTTWPRYGLIQRHSNPFAVLSAIDVSGCWQMHTMPMLVAVSAV